MPNTKEQLSDSVKTEIEDSIQQYSRWYKRFSIAASAISILSIFSSFAAGVCATTDAIKNRMLAVTLAGLPALLLTIDQAFKFRARSEWFWTLVLRYQALQRSLERGDISDEEASRKIDNIEDQMNPLDPMLPRAQIIDKSRDG